MITGYLISDHFSIFQLIPSIVIALIGNMIGGSLFVAILNYAHIRKTQIHSE